MIARDRTAAVWAVLVLATLASWVLGEDKLIHTQDVVATGVIAHGVYNGIGVLIIFLQVAY